MDFLITFDDLKPGSKAVKRLVQAFTRAGANVATTDTDGKAKRTAGVSYRELALTFTDNQKVLLSIKQTGDVYQVKINGSVMPIRNQDNQVKAVAEIVQMLDAGRAKFQAKMARQKVALPKGIKTAAPRMEEKLRTESERLDQELASAQARADELRAELGEAMDSVGSGSGEEELKELDIESAKAVAQAVIKGETLDDATHALATLNNALEVVENNYPINVARGNLAQAELEKEVAASIKEAIGVLDAANGETETGSPGVTEDDAAHTETDPLHQDQTALDL